VAGHAAACGHAAASDLCFYLVCTSAIARRWRPSRNLLICDAVLIYWGTADEFWLRTKMRDMIRIRGRGRGRDKPLRGSAIYVAEPQDDDKQEFATREAQLMGERGEFAPAALELFIAAIKRATSV
jgi:hypothetical protein